MVKKLASRSNWHSSLGMDAVLSGKREVRIAATEENLAAFVKVGKEGSFLVNRASNQLWEYDQKTGTIVKLFDDDEVPLSI